MFALHFVSFKVVTAAIVALYGMPRTQLAVFPALVVGGSWWWLAYTVAGVVLPVSARYALGRLRTSVRVARRPERPPSDLPPLRLS